LKKILLQESLNDILTGRLRKQKLVSFLEKHPELFEETVEVSLSDEQPQAWRAAWLIFHYMEKNDSRLIPFIDHILSCISNKGDGHQRELLKVLNKMELSEDQEGILFDRCLTIWEEIHKSPSVRGTAFQTLLRIVEKYPELKCELEHLTQDHYTKSLSPGIRNSFEKMINKDK